MTQRNKTIALALAGSALVGALTVGHAVWAQTGEDPIPLATTASSRPADKLEAQYAVLAGSEQNAESLIAGLREALADAPESIALPELQEVAAQMPALGRALIALHRRRLQADERLETLALGLGDDRGQAVAARAMPFEVVRDFFFDHQNHFDAVDRAAETLAAQAPGAQGGQLGPWLTERLRQRHGVQLVLAGDGSGAKRSYDPTQRRLLLSRCRCECG